MAMKDVLDLASRALEQCNVMLEGIKNRDKQISLCHDQIETHKKIEKNQEEQITILKELVARQADNDHLLVFNLASIDPITLDQLISLAQRGICPAEVVVHRIPATPKEGHHNG